MQKFMLSLHVYTKKVGPRTNFFRFHRKLVLSLVYGSLAELLEIFHKLKSSLACTSTSSFVSLGDLSLGISLEGLDFGVDFFYKLFHFR